MASQDSTVSQLSGLALLLGIVLGGCSFSNPSDSCNCPRSGFASLYLPLGLSSPVVAVVVTPPCTTGDGRIDGSFTMYGGYDGGTTQLTINVEGSDPVTCEVYATLEDGTELEAVVTFERRENCCGGIAPIGSNVMQLRKHDSGAD
jgi:hypothetical protein